MVADIICGMLIVGFLLFLMFGDSKNDDRHFF